MSPALRNLSPRVTSAAISAGDSRCCADASADPARVCGGSPPDAGGLGDDVFGSGISPGRNGAGVVSARPAWGLGGSGTAGGVAPDPIRAGTRCGCGAMAGDALSIEGAEPSSGLLKFGVFT